MQNFAKYYFSMPSELLNTKNTSKTTHTITNSNFKDVELVKLMTDALRNYTRYRVRVEGWSKEYSRHFESDIKTIEHWNTLDFNYDPLYNTFVFTHRRKKQ